MTSREQVSFFNELLGLLILPPLLAVGVLVIALVAARCQLPYGQRGVLAVAARPETCTLLLWVLLLLYPSLAKTSFMPFDCIEVGGQTLLRADTSVTCYDEAWCDLASRCHLL